MSKNKLKETDKNIFDYDFNGKTIIIPNSLCPKSNTEAWKLVDWVWENLGLNLIHNFKYREVSMVLALRLLFPNLQWVINAKYDARHDKRLELKSSGSWKSLSSVYWEFDKLHDEGRIEEICKYDDQMAFGIFEGPKFFSQVVIPTPDIESTSRIKDHLREEKAKVLKRKEAKPRSRDAGKISFSHLVSLLPASTQIVINHNEVTTLRFFLDSLGKEDWITYGEKNERKASNMG